MRPIGLGDFSEAPNLGISRAMLKRVANPPNRYSSQVLEWLDVVPEAQLEIFEEDAVSIVTRNESPDVGFNFSVNPYRGCYHGCTYCYARPTHQYLDFGAGSDFERKIIVKRNAPQLLEQSFMKSSWKGDAVFFSGITDCYQPLEAHYEITGRCLKVCHRFQNPVGIITKGYLICRDKELLAELNKVAGVQVYISLAFIDDKLSKLFEPNAPRPSTRLRAIKELSDLGIQVGVAVAPVIPGINDTQIPAILESAYRAGARKTFCTLLRLPAEVAEVFTTSLATIAPDRMNKVMNQLRRMKGGKLNRSGFGERMVGDGEEWKAVKWLFEQTAEKLGYNSTVEAPATPEGGTKNFRRPTDQLSLPGF